MVIAFVALVVIGPEKLPKVARTAGAFFGRLQRFVTQVKDEVNREARFAELQTLQQEVKSSLQQGYNEIEQSILPSISPDVELVKEPVSDKKIRKPRQRKASATVVEASALEQSQTDLVADPQAELFAVPAEEKKTRRPRKAVQKEEGTPVPEQKPLA